MDVDTLEQTLKTQQWVGGQQPTSADTEAYEAVKGQNISAATHPSTFAWFCLVMKFTDAVRATWGGAAPAKGGKAAAKPKEEVKAEAEKADDLDDLFGDDNGDEEGAETAKKIAEAAKANKKKKVVIAKSVVYFDVKPLDSETDLDEMAKRIIALEGEGIHWRTEYKKEPVAFGIFKLVIGVTVEDEKVSVDGLVERIEAMDDIVQSVEIVAFNKV